MGRVIHVIPMIHRMIFFFVGAYVLYVFMGRVPETQDEAAIKNHRRAIPLPQSSPGRAGRSET